MPGYDGTGPRGEGPLTGRGFGFCVLPTDEYENLPRRGRGQGFGHGWRGGRGRGWGRGRGMRWRHRHRYGWRNRYNEY